MSPLKVVAETNNQMELSQSSDSIVSPQSSEVEKRGYADEEEEDEDDDGEEDEEQDLDHKMDFNAIKIDL